MNIIATHFGVTENTTTKCISETAKFYNVNNDIVMNIIIDQIHKLKMWTLSDIEDIRDYCVNKDEFDSCDIFMDCAFDYIYNTEKEEIKINDISMLEYYLDKDNILFVELGNGRIGGLYRTLVHFFILFKGKNYPIVLQSYANRYFGKISEWPNWKEDLLLLFKYNQGKIINYNKLNNTSVSKDRIIAWNRIFNTDYDNDTDVPIDIYIFKSKNT
jgi:hypothetical protein